MILVVSAAKAEAWGTQSSIKHARASAHTCTRVTARTELLAEGDVAADLAAQDAVEALEVDDQDVGVVVQRHALARGREAPAAAAAVRVGAAERVG